jgi:biotin synthase
MSPFEKAQQLYERAINNNISEDDLDTVINWKEEEISVLFSCTDQIRRHFFGNEVSPCAIMNIKSGGCPEDCAFCSQSVHNDAQIDKNSLSEQADIIENVRIAHSHDLFLGVVASGRKLSTREIEHVAAALKECGGENHSSLGILSDEEFAILRDAGVVCYNHNLETSRNFFSQIVSTHTFDDRIETVKRAKKFGMSVCCGGIFGLGETWQDRKDLCLEIKKLDIETIPLNFVNAIPGTKIAPPKESPMEFLKIISLFRVGHPDKIIKIGGGREVNLRKARNLMFFAGANGYISGDYLTTKGDSIESDDEMIKDLGLIKSVSLHH